MKGTLIFVGGVIGGILTVVWGAVCFLAGCIFVDDIHARGKSYYKPDFKEVRR
jgi:hypothetical protein